MPRIDLIQGTSLDSIVGWVADKILHLYLETASDTETFNLALAGGSTPRLLYERLSSPLWRTRINWAQVSVFLGDERYVPVGDPRSNYRMVSETLLDKVMIPPRNVHPIPTVADDIAADAATYEQALADSLPTDDSVPVFDVALVGLGPDGYIAGLFPGSKALREETRLAVGLRPPQAPAPWISLTPRVFNAARHVIMLTAGALKAGALSHTLARGGSAEEIPARALDPSPGTFTIVADAEACAELNGVDLRPGIVRRRL